MTCSACVNSIESNVMKLRGMISASISLSLNSGRFKFNPQITGPRDLIDAVNVCNIFTRTFAIYLIEMCIVNLGL